MVCKEKKSVTLVGLKHVFIGDFKNTFEKNFYTSHNFSEAVTLDFSDGFSSAPYLCQTTIGISSEWNRINSMTSKKNYLTIQGLFDSSHSDFIVVLDNFKIGNRMEVVKNSNFSKSNLFNNFIVSSCNVRVYDAKSKNILFEFDAIGEDNIRFFSYSSAMKSAKKQMVSNALIFISTHCK